MAEKIIYDFGMADFIFDEGTENEIRFDGKLCDENSFIQVEGGSVELTPTLTEIPVADFGDTVFDHVVNGFEGTITISAAKATLKLLDKIASGTVSIENETGEIVSITDDRIGTSLRSKGKRLTVRPRGMGDDRSEDINIHKVVNTSGFTREFENERGVFEIELSILPKDCADPTRPNNYFYIGEDPESLTAFTDKYPDVTIPAG